MKKIFLIISLTFFSFNSAFAVTLYDALNQTYKNNLELQAERKNLDVQNEVLNISKSLRIQVNLLIKVGATQPSVMLTLNLHL